MQIFSQQEGNSKKDKKIKRQRYRFRAIWPLKISTKYLFIEICLCKYFLYCPVYSFLCVCIGEFICFFVYLFVFLHTYFFLFLFVSLVVYYFHCIFIFLWLFVFWSFCNLVIVACCSPKRESVQSPCLLF